MFTVHSPRGASSSATDSRITTTHIQKAANLSTESVFRRLYSGDFITALVVILLMAELYCIAEVVKHKSVSLLV